MQPRGQNELSISGNSYVNSVSSKLPSSNSGTIKNRSTVSNSTNLIDVPSGEIQKNYTAHQHQMLSNLNIYNESKTKFTRRSSKYHNITEDAAFSTLQDPLMQVKLDLSIPVLRAHSSNQWTVESLRKYLSLLPGTETYQNVIFNQNIADISRS